MTQTTATTTDPLAANCRTFAVDAQGRVVGVKLTVDVRPAARYELVRAELIDEMAAQGNTVATCVVLDAQGIPLGQPAELAWPWPNLANFALPGNPNNQHMITNGYTPPNIGPLALCIRQNGIIISDVLGGLGLPGNRHVSYRATWRERAGDGGDDGKDDDGGGTPVLPERATVALERLAAASERTAVATERLAMLVATLADRLGFGA